jgi:photosystem II stability/assembly factor-like uncharacterized protein
VKSLAFRDCAFLNERFGYAVGDRGLICRTTNGGATWVQISHGSINDILQVRICDRSTAWAVCAGGLVLQTIDGGDTWTPISLGGGTIDLTSIDFVNGQGFIVGRSGAAFSFQSARCRSVDLPVAGLPSGVTTRLTGVSFISPSFGCVSGPGGLVLTTGNGGASWTPSPTGTGADLTGVYLIGNAGFITGYGGLICVSRNGGRSWTPFTTNTSVPFFAAAFSSSFSGFAAGGGGTICRYDGTRWTPTPTDTTADFYGIAIAGRGAVAVGAGGIICRYNGTRWVPVPSPASGALYDVAFCDSERGYAVGQGGTILRTRDGGRTWEPLFVPVNLDIRRIKVGDPGTAWAVCDGGLVLETRSGGESWAPIPVGEGEDLLAVDFLAGRGFVVGDLGKIGAFRRDGVAELVSTISGPDQVCSGARAVYHASSNAPAARFGWTVLGAGSIVGPAQGDSVVVTAGAAGSFTLAVEAEGGGCTARGEFTATVGSCGSRDCPRTAGFWKKQCESQQGPASLRLTRDQITRIAQCADERSGYFAWSQGTDLDRFCEVIEKPAPNNHLRKARRQFAALLANLCVAQLGYATPAGDAIGLGPDVPVSCKDFSATTIGQLAAEVDNALVALERRPPPAHQQLKAYESIYHCLKDVNHGKQTRPTCDPRRITEFDDDDNDDPLILLALEGLDAAAVNRISPAPNPFSLTTTIRYAVEAERGEEVLIAVYDAAGRRARTLVSGVRSPGSYSVSWDGRTDDGAALGHGLYFVRRMVGTQIVRSRVLYLP